MGQLCPRVGAAGVPLAELSRCVLRSTAGLCPGRRGSAHWGPTCPKDRVMSKDRQAGHSCCSPTWPAT